MKILVLIDAWFPFVGGAQVQIRNLKKILKKKYSCHYFILHSPSANIVVRLLWSIWVIPQVILLNFKHRFDLIHSHAYWPGVPGKILSTILKIPAVFTVHGSNLLDLKSKSFKAWLEKIILTKIKYDKVISTSSNFLSYKNVNKDIMVIHNGVEIDRFKSSSGSKVHQVQRLLFVGRIEEVKGLEYLIRAFKMALKELKDIELIIIGKGSDENRLKRLVENLGIRNKIIFKHYFNYDDLIKEYLEADVFVLPSLSEGQPLTLLEAWAAKLPVVATAVGENTNMIKDGYNGYLVKPGNAKALAAAILKVIRNKNRMLMGKRGYQLVKKHYHWKKSAQKTYKIYCRVLNE